MSLYLNTRGLASAAVAICDRCKFKRPLVSLVSDPNFPGLRVCEDGCVDVFDPWRLPARRTENITLKFPRPEVGLTVPYIIQAENGEAIETEEGDPLETEQEN